MPLVQTLREGSHPLVFGAREFGASGMGNLDMKQSMAGNNNGSGAIGGNATDQTPQFACPDCGRMYKLKSSLRNHQKWECGKEPQFQCPYCVYRAKQKMHIGRHMERMHKERFFKVESDKVVALDMGGPESDMNAMNSFNINMNNTC
uniref:CSON008522 protein n=1 Tax=Culicoides sonorensis TaxID=179676 RepID=A0A336LF31_CULSO